MSCGQPMSGTTFKDFRPPVTKEQERAILERKIALITKHLEELKAQLKEMK